jgi:hypothetical protein
MKLNVKAEFQNLIIKLQWERNFKVEFHDLSENSNHCNPQIL